MLSRADFVHIGRLHGSLRKGIVVLQKLVAIAAFAGAASAAVVTESLHRSRPGFATQGAADATGIGSVVGVCVIDVIRGPARKFITQNKLTVSIEGGALPLLDEMLLSGLDKCPVLLLCPSSLPSRGLLPRRLSSLCEVGVCRWPSAAGIKVALESEVSIVSWGGNEIRLAMSEIFIVETIVG